MPNKQDWEEELKTKIEEIINDNINYYVMLRDLDDQYHQALSEVSAFSAEQIQSLLSQREAEIRKETILAVMPEDAGECGEDFGCGFNNCLQHIKDSAKSLYNLDLE